MLNTVTNARMVHTIVDRQPSNPVELRKGQIIQTPHGNYGVILNPIASQYRILLFHPSKGVAGVTVMGSHRFAYLENSEAEVVLQQLDQDAFEKVYRTVCTGIA